jgi:hypothetical protein
MAGTTGLEPATSAVTVSQNPVTYRNNGQWMAPFSAIRHTKEQLSWPYCAHDFDLIYPLDLCRPAALVAFFGLFLCLVAAEVRIGELSPKRTSGETGAQLCPRLWIIFIDTVGKHKPTYEDESCPLQFDDLAGFQIWPDWIGRECLSPAAVPDLAAIVEITGEIDGLLSGHCGGTLIQ